MERATVSVHRGLREAFSGLSEGAATTTVSSKNSHNNQDKKETYQFRAKDESTKQNTTGLFSFFVFAGERGVSGATRLLPLGTSWQETQDEEELNIAPKKANWDLKRDVEKKLEKLNRRTQRAIVEIIRERMAEVPYVHSTRPATFVGWNVILVPYWNLLMIERLLSSQRLLERHHAAPDLG